MIEGMSADEFFQSVMPVMSIPVQGHHVIFKDRSLRSIIASAYGVPAANVDRVKKGGPASQSARFGKATTKRFASYLAGRLRAPVLDKTDLTGQYDIALDLTPSTPDEPSSVAVIRAVEELGLKLQSAKVTVDAIVVDSMSKVPTPN